jgi:hypothetical protein
VSKSADRARTRALRLLAREHYDEYAEIYEQVRPTTPDRFQARNEARMQLRHQYPSRYLEVHAQQEACPGTNVPAGIRSKSWQRATARLADLRAPAYRDLFGQFRAQGMNQPTAYDRAMAILRDDDSDLFTQMLTEEYQLWLTVSATATPSASTQDTRAPGEDRPAARRTDGRPGQGSAGQCLPWPTGRLEGRLAPGRPQKARHVRERPPQSA